MNNLNPINQTKLFGLDNYLNELIRLFNQEKYPNKILFSGQKGIGKSTFFRNLVPAEYNYFIILLNLRLRILAIHSLAYH